MVNHGLVMVGLWLVYAIEIVSFPITNMVNHHDLLYANHDS
jgi:hypothetical protein